MPILKFSKDHKTFVVEHLAMYDTPTEVIAALKENFADLTTQDISIQAVLWYDISNPKQPKKWKELFNETRAAFKEGRIDIAIADKNFRLRQLEALYKNHKKNPVVASSILAQAAKETGGAYTNKHQLQIPAGDDGSPGGAAVLLYIPANGREDSDDLPQAEPPPIEKKSKIKRPAK